MKCNSFIYSAQLLIVIKICLITRVHGNTEEDTWMEPDAWGRDHLSLSSLHSAFDKCCKCSDDSNQENTAQQSSNEQQKITEHVASLIYFKKFITMLFNRKHFKYDSTLQIYERSIVFTLQSSQLDKLDQLQDPRDLDIILMEVFDNVRIPNMHCDGHMIHKPETASGFKLLLFDVFNDMWQLTKTSEIRFLLIVTIVLLTAWIFNTRYNIGWLSLIFGGIFIYGYLHTYLECNRELEINEMLEILNRNKGSQGIENYSRFVQYFKSIFSSVGPQDLEHQKLKQSAKITFGFCRPDHVLIMYFNDIFLKYLQVLLEQCTTTLTTLNESLSFPYNILSGFFMICIIGYILKLTFKYILSPTSWVQLVRKNHHQTPNNSGDHISGDNLKLLLNVISAAPKRNNATLKPAVSGVEEVKETIEAANKNITEKLEECPKSTSSKNNNKNNVISDVTLEDLSEKS